MDNNLHNPILKIINWWEGKRIWFNVVVFGFLLIQWFLVGGMPNVYLSKSPYINIVVWIIGANIFYSVGWILEVYLTYLKERLNLKLDSFLELLAKSRIILFLLGTLASVFWTWVNILSIVGSNTPY